MHRFLPSPAFVIGCYVGMLITALFGGVTSYQAGHCNQIQQSAEAKPNAEQPAGAPKSEDEEREREVAEYAKSHPITCGVVGVIGLVPFTIGYMDHHEGFFVGTFTLALFGATFFLWRSTENLWRSGERQIGHVETSATAAKEAAEVARKTLSTSNRAWLKATICISEELGFSAQSANIGIGIQLLNFGNAPDSNITFQAWLIPRYMTAGTMRSKQTPFQVHEAHCVSARTRRSKKGFMLFPNETFPQAQGFSAYGIGPFIDRRDFEKAIFQDSGKNVVVFYVGGVINYTFATDDNIHQTSFLFELCYRGMHIAFDTDVASYPARELSLGGITEWSGRQAD